MQKNKGGNDNPTVTMKPLAVLLWIPLLAPFWAVGPGPKSPAGQELKDRFSLQHQVAVTLKLIQVSVTDKKGNPITDLAKEDFIVWDNGEEKTITEFEKHTLSLPASATPVGEHKEATLAWTLPLLGRKFLFFFDTVFVDVKGFRIARDAALRFIQNDLRPEDEIAVVSFSGAGNLRIYEFLTKDRAGALAAVRVLSPGNLMRQLTSDLEESRIVAKNFIWALRTLAQALRYVSGKKHLILYSNGILGAIIARGEFADGTHTDISQDYAKMCDELAASDISVYAVNTADSKIGLVRIGEDGWKESDTGVPSLREMASQTGGRFLGAVGNSDEHMQKINALTGAYYVVGYPVREAWDGKFHTIRVKIRRSGAEVHAQPGYFNPKPFSEYSELERKIDLVDLALADKPLSQDPVRFAMDALPGAGTPPNNVHAIAEISSAGLADVAGKRVEFVSILFNALDKIIDLRRAGLDLTPETLGKSRGFLFAGLSASPGNYKCRIVLRNLETGRAAVAGSTIAVPALEPGKILISSPLLLVPGGEALYLAGDDGLGNRLSAQEQIAGALLFDPRKFSPCPEAPLKSHSSIFASFQCAIAGGDKSKLALSASLTDESAGTESPLPLTILAEKEGKGTTTFFVRLDLPEVEWGAYILALVARDDVTGLSARVTRVISIE